MIEAEGYAYHAGHTSFEDDRRRRRTLAVRGFIVVPCTWQALTHESDLFVAELEVIYARYLANQRLVTLAETVEASGWLSSNESAPDPLPDPFESAESP